MIETLIKKNNLHILGEGTKNILFVHGYGCNQTMWRFLTPAFKQKYKLYLIDLVGCGLSDTNSYDFSKYANLNGYAEDIVELVEKLELENTILIGHSVSSIIIGLASILKPELFQNLIMICPSPYYINDGNYIGGFEQKDIDGLIETVNSNYLGWASAITPVIIGNKEKTEFAEELTNSFCRNDPKIAKHFAEVTFKGDYRNILEQINVPTLIIQCKEDVIAPVSVGEFMNKKISNSKLDLLNAVGHCPHLTDPELTIHSIQNFIV